MPNEPKAGWGGARHGAGKPRTTVKVRLHKDIVRRVAEIAETEGETVDSVVAVAVLDFVQNWHSSH